MESSSSDLLLAFIMLYGSPATLCASMAFKKAYAVKKQSQYLLLKALSTCQMQTLTQWRTKLVPDNLLISFLVIEISTLSALFLLIPCLLPRYWISLHFRCSDWLMHAVRTVFPTLYIILNMAASNSELYWGWVSGNVYFFSRCISWTNKLICPHWPCFFVYIAKTGIFRGLSWTNW